MKRMTLLALSAAVVSACGLPDPEPLPPQLDPAPLAKAVQAQLQLPAEDPGQLEHRVFQLEDIDGWAHADAQESALSPQACDAVDASLAEVCSALYEDGEAIDYCWYESSFFYAHSTPRCAVRFHVMQTGAGMEDLFVLDIAGPPTDGPAPLCGNAQLDDGELCDDGNLESWDGCDATCMPEEFEMCEQLVEERFAAAGVAVVDRGTWSGPRSHLMINDASALHAPVTDCAEVEAAATDTCERMAFEVPFVSWCQARVEPVEGGCAVRLESWFQDLDPELGVFTTSLPGVLAFTVR
jgi:cysteine-rich repeat protein